MPPIGVVEERFGQALLLRLTGDLDAAAVMDCIDAIRQATASAPPPRLVVLDLAGLDLLSAAGIHAFGRLARLHAECGVRTAIVNGEGLGPVLEQVLRRQVPEIGPAPDPPTGEPGPDGGRPDGLDRATPTGQS
ncbi:STAS domain-containing protein [Actinosynnema sp. NPDC050436]|uniref:STAS domain-containing protein n=1 Tax=Actinosynnema sp. NPDC050436 TaxID=3155659 RepID=UPI0033E0694E